MSIHSSLKKKGFARGHRNVLKKFERFKKLVSEEKWTDQSTILGMVKIKSIKIKQK